MIRQSLEWVSAVWANCLETVDNFLVVVEAALTLDRVLDAGDDVGIDRWYRKLQEYYVFWYTHTAACIRSIPTFQDFRRFQPFNILIDTFNPAWTTGGLYSDLPQISTDISFI